MGVKMLLPFDHCGFVKLSLLQRMLVFKDLNTNRLIQIVRDDAKQRFSVEQVANSHPDIVVLHVRGNDLAESICRQLLLQTFWRFGGRCLPRGSSEWWSPRCHRGFSVEREMQTILHILERNKMGMQAPFFCGEWNSEKWIRHWHQGNKKSEVSWTFPGGWSASN